MKNIYFVVFVVMLSLVTTKHCFAQISAWATSTASACIININDLFKENNIHALKSRADSIRAIDSILSIKQQAIIPELVRVGFSTTEDVQRIFGNNFENFPILNQDKKKWVYKDKTVWFINDIVDVVIYQK